MDLYKVNKIDTGESGFKRATLARRVLEQKIHLMIVSASSLILYMMRPTLPTLMPSCRGKPEILKLLVHNIFNLEATETAFYGVPTG